VLGKDVTVIKFSDVTCVKLRLRDWQTTAIVHHRVAGTDTLLARIKKDGNTNLAMTPENERAGKKVGHTIQRKCFIFRKYLKADCSLLYCNTSYWCYRFHTTLCNVDLRQPELGRKLTCEGEAGFIKILTPAYQVNTHPRQTGHIGHTSQPFQPFQQPQFGTNGKLHY
jgi:hypothetical protein